MPVIDSVDLLIGGCLILMAVVAYLLTFGLSPADEDEDEGGPVVVFTDNDGNEFTFTLDDEQTVVADAADETPKV